LNHSTILITRTLSTDDADRLREKLGELWPGESFTIVHGEMTTEDARRAWTPGPSELKAEWTDATPVPRYEG
jgi:hypothetical protein